MDYSIVIPVFNKLELTRQCLDALPRTLVGAGEGEVIVVDNASSDGTAAALRTYPWVRVISNERNLGFAAACNQGARAAQGRFVVHLNNDIVPYPGWLNAMLAAATPDVGIVGALLLFPDKRIQHAGVLATPSRFGIEGFAPYHYLYELPGTYPFANVGRDLQMVTGACLLTPRDLYLELGGFDEIFWNGYEDIDYCLKVKERGLRVVYEPRAKLLHYESQSGIERRRRILYNISVLAQRWRGRAAIDENLFFPQMGVIRREMCLPYGARKFMIEPFPPITLFVHGPAPADPEAFLRDLLRGAYPTERIVWNAAGPPPASDGTVESAPGDAAAAARVEMERRGDRYLIFVNSRSRLQPGWMQELVRHIEWGYDVAATTFAPELGFGEEVSALSADARCTLLSLQEFAQEERLGEFATLDGALCDFLLRGQRNGKGVRGVSRSLGDLPALGEDAAFAAKYEASIAGFLRDDPEHLEGFLREWPRPPARGLASIVMLSWNAWHFTQVAMNTIRAVTGVPYEIIIIDNGSRPDTIDYLRTLENDPDVRVIYNRENRGFAHGCNQGIAAARGEFVVLLNNDVAVTEGWLESLLGAFDRIPGLGVSAPRSNNVAGDQRVVDAAYSDFDGMQAYAARRRRDYRRAGYLTDRAIGFCLCIKRSLLEEIGGIDERFGVGNFEDDDFCVRVRAAGYKIFICDDVFIHHAGSASFQENKIDYSATMLQNWQKFAAKWGLPKDYPQTGYVARPAIRMGFRKAEHYVALPAAPAPPAQVAGSGDYRLVVLAAIRSESDWDDVGGFARKFVERFDVAEGIALLIAAVGPLDAATIGARVEKYAARCGRVPEAIPDVIVSDAADLEAWLHDLPQAPRVGIGAALEARGSLATLGDRSPSGLRRYAESLAPALLR